MVLIHTLTFFLPRSGIMWRSIAGARFVGPRVRPTSTAPICVLIPRAVVPHAQRSRWQRQSRNPSGTDGSQTPRWRKTDSNCRSPLRRGAFLNRLLPPLQPAKPVETEVFDPRGTDGSNPSSSSGESMPNLFELEDVGPRSHQAEKREPIRPPPEAPAYWDLSGGGHTPATACSGSAVQAGSSKTLFGRP